MFFTYSSLPANIYSEPTSKHVLTLGFVQNAGVIINGMEAEPSKKGTCLWAEYTHIDRVASTTTIVDDAKFCNKHMQNRD